MNWPAAKVCHWPVAATHFRNSKGWSLSQPTLSSGAIV